jgi:hypothetical protein
MNETLLNVTANITQNQTVNQTVNQVGQFALDKALNSNWGDALAQTINGFTGQHFSGSIVTALIPLVTIALIYWKWGSLLQAVDTVGKTVLLLLMGYVVAKAFGVL